MKKIMAIISLIIIGASLGLYQYYYGGSSYYTKIVDSGTEITQTVDTTKEEYQDNRYEQLAFNEK